MSLVHYRVFSDITQAMSPLGLLVAGPVAQAYGVPFWFVLTGVVFAVIGAVGLLIPDVIHIEEQASEHAGPFRFPAVGKA